MKYIMTLLLLSFSVFAHASSWKEINGSWLYDSLPEDACGFYKVKISTAGFMHVDRCGEFLHKQITPVDMTKLNVLMTQVMANFENPTVCDQIQTTDYDWQYFVTDTTGKSRKVFWQGGPDGSCSRGRSGAYEALDTLIHTLVTVE